MMRKLTLLVLPLVLLAAACGGEAAIDEDVATADVSTALEQLETQAADLANQVEGTEGAALQDTLMVIQRDLDTVATAATAGEISAEDVDRLRGSLDEFQLDLSQFEAQLDPALAEQLRSFQDELEAMLPQLTR